MENKSKPIKIFISYSYKHRKKFLNFHQKLKKFLKKINIELYSFVFEFKLKVDNKKMMKSALKKIDESDILITEASFKQIGIGIEAGYAKAKDKKIIYIKKKGSELSTTLDGISDIFIEYANFKDLSNKLQSFFSLTHH
jgi:nucleoside 2-deoxyribosyltransferase